MEHIQLPRLDQEVPVDRVIIDPNLVIGTAIGLVKPANEDRLGYLAAGDNTRLCIVDGHWGEEAADIIIRHWLNKEVVFPASQEAAIEEVKSTQGAIFQRVSEERMKGNRDFNPEAAFIAVQAGPDALSIVSYGDCRLMVARNGEVAYEHPTEQTWLGVSSLVGGRGRLSASEGTVYCEVPFRPGDLLILFTDGVDECKYERPTIPIQDIAALSAQISPVDVFTTIMDRVFQEGAEDNASLDILATV